MLRLVLPLGKLLTVIYVALIHLSGPSVLASLFGAKLYLRTDTREVETRFSFQRNAPVWRAAFTKCNGAQPQCGRIHLIMGDITTSSCIII